MQLLCVKTPYETRYHLNLSATGNDVPDLLHRVLVMACEWIPSKACKSFTVYDFRYTDYYRSELNNPSNFASFSVKYFSTESEGMFKVADYIGETYIGKYNNGVPTHSPSGKPIGEFAKQLRKVRL